MNHSLRSSLLLLTLAVAVTGLNFCPTPEYIEEWIEATETVQVFVGSIFSSVASTSLSTMEVYRRIATEIGATITSTGFAHFKEAIDEITAAKLSACSLLKRDEVTKSDMSKLVEDLVKLDYKDPKNMNQICIDIGQLLCLQDLLYHGDSLRRKREESDEDEVHKFFNSLKGKQFRTIFIYDNIHSLAFVVDDTGSMSDEIASVQKIIHSFIKSERSEPASYILVTFNDPEVGIPQKFDADNATELQALNETVNALNAHEGGDCPELGMTGILAALSLAYDLSNVIVLTDASPLDANRMQEVIDTAVEMETSVHFFINDPCGDVSPYLEVANKTEAIVVHKIDDFEALAEFVNKVSSFENHQSELPVVASRWKKKRQTGLPTDYCATFSVSNFTRSLDILFSTASEITITNPLNSKVEVKPSNYNSSIATYSSKDPVIGVYKICSTKSFEFSLSIPSDLDFVVHYLNASISSTSLPFPGTSIKIVIVSSRIKEISQSNEIFLNLLSGREIISSNVISHCGEVLAGVFIVPNVPFRYQLVGHDFDGNMFTKTKKGILNPQKMCNALILTSAVLKTTLSSHDTFAFTTSKSAHKTSYLFTTSTTNYPTSSTTSYPTSTSIYPTSSTTSYPTSSTSIYPTSSSTSPSPHCPCQNGGRCINIIRFGRMRTRCRCALGYTGSHCQIRFYRGK